MRVSDTRKQRIINSCVVGARKYSRLVGHYFELTTEDNQVFEIQFNKDDFKHLTGISSFLSSNDFYKNCLNGIITKQNINDNQKKDWNSIKGKLNIIEEIDEMIYGNINDVLLIDVLYTQTRNFPLALRNDTKDSAVAFIDSNLHARSLRKARHSLNVKATYQIKRIRERRKNEETYSRTIYEN